jgi:hypothetical protein
MSTIAYILFGKMRKKICGIAYSDLCNRLRIKADQKGHKCYYGRVHHVKCLRGR